MNPDEHPVEHHYTAMGRWDIPPGTAVAWYQTFPLECGHDVQVRESTPLDEGVLCEHPGCMTYNPPALPVDWEAVWASARPDTCLYRFPDGRGCVFGFGHMVGYHLPELPSDAWERLGRNGETTTTTEVAP